MKTAINIILGYLTCTKQEVINKWTNIAYSYWHKDDGKIVTDISQDTTKTDISVLDGDGVASTVSIPSYTEPQNFPISKIQDLAAQLGEKVDKVAGKGLTTNDFDNTFRDKLILLENYVHPDTHPIAMVDGLQDLLDGISDQLNQLNQSLIDISTRQFIVIDGYRTYKAVGNNSSSIHEAGDVFEGRGIYAGGDYIKAEVTTAATQTDPIELNILIQQR